MIHRNSHFVLKKLKPFTGLIKLVDEKPNWKHGRMIDYTRCLFNERKIKICFLHSCHHHSSKTKFVASLILKEDVEAKKQKTLSM